MNKEELVEALKEAGIVSMERDGKGAKLFVSMNDFDETMGEKQSAKRIKSRLISIQYWAVIVTMVCVVLTTVIGITGKNEKYKYFSKNGYILRYNDTAGTTCVIPENRMVASAQKQLGQTICHQ